VRVVVDHTNLKGFINIKQLNGRQARWATFLALFDFFIEYRVGKRNPANPPLRRPDYAAESQAISTLLPTLLSKLSVWAKDTDDDEGEPYVQRIRATCVAQAIEQELPVSIL
jgi:hypothetical protein